MRNRVTSLTAALVLASASVAMAQATSSEPQQKPDETAAPKMGMVEIGSRFSSISGDEARYQRYRDLRNGTNINLSLNHEGAGYLFEATATNVGYRDGHYVVNYQNGRAKFSFVYDRLPLNYSHDTRTPWVEVAPNVFDLDANARATAQTAFVAGTNLPGNLTAIPSTKAQAGLPSIYRSLATPFNLEAQRDTIGAAVEFQATQNVTATASVSSYARSGHQPWGASFAFNNANELPITVDNRTTDLSTGLEYATAKGSIRVGYDGSFFQNHTPFLTWDNPLFATDYNLDKTTVTGYDPSGYSNGRGPAMGRMSLPPSNRLNSVNAVGLYKLPSHSTLSGTFFVTSMTQNSPLAPWTINPVIANPAVYALFPGLAQLPRDTAEASVLYTNAQVAFTTRPNRYVSFNAKYRYNNRDDRTALFDAVEYVRFDAVPEETGGETEHLNIRRNTLDANVTLTPIPFTAFRIGYGHDDFNRTGRAFSDMADNIFRVSADVVGNQYLTIRAMYEHTKREGSGFSEDAIEEGGAQPGLRFYDEANRNRNRATLIFEVTPVSAVGLSFSYAHGKDEYNGPGHEFGLLSNDNNIYTAGVNVVPGDKVRFGLNYGWEKYNSLQQSRNANPPPDAQFNDPNRNWTLTNPEKVKNFNLYLDLIKAIAKTDIRFGYDFSDSDQAFTFGGPRVNPAVAGSLAAVGQFVPLPNVTNKWNRATAEIQYYITPKVGVSASYWYEKFDVTDFATVNLAFTQTPRIDYLGEISTGYGNRPYKANTGFLRLFYLF